MKKFSKLAIILSVVMALIIPTAAEAKSRGTSSKHRTSHSSSSKKVNPHHGPTHVQKGYTKKNGTHVAPHLKTKANKTKKDNYRIAN